MSPLLLLSQCAITELGFDMPHIIVDIDCRPSLSKSSWMQRRGRPSRVYPAVVGDRAYQTRIINETRACLARKQNTLIVSPCGSGKGEMECMIAFACNAKGKSVAIVTPRRLLVDDLSNRLTRYGVPHGVVMANRTDNHHPIKVVSLDTAIARDITFNVDLLLVDECHLYLSDARKAFLDRHSHIPKVFATATPIRGDGQGLGRIADAMVLGPSIRELQALGFLVPSKVYSAPEIDTSKIAITGDDFNQKQIAAVMNKPGLVANAVKEYIRLAPGLPGIIHACSVAHSKALANRFTGAGFPTAHVDADTPDEEREDIFARLRLSAVPKTHSILIDCAANVLHMGLPDADQNWTLSDQDEVSRKPTCEGLSVRRCPVCWFTFEADSDSCPSCKSPYVPTQRKIKERQAELVEYNREQKERAIGRWQSSLTTDQKLQRLEKIVADVRAKGWKPGAAIARYKATVGEDVPRDWFRLIFKK